MSGNATRSRAAPVRRHTATVTRPLAAMHRHADEAVALLKAVGSHKRLLLLCQLVEGERGVGELARALDLSQSTVSQHLALLRHDGIVSARREAQSIRYRISDERARTLMQTLFGMFCATRG